MLHAYLGLTSNVSRLRANAIEFLDNVLDSDLKKSLIPIVESARPELLKNKQHPLPSQMSDAEESIRYVLRGDDIWLSACALYLIAMYRYRQFEDSVRPLLKAQHPMVRETARLCIQLLELTG